MVYDPPADRGKDQKIKRNEFVKNMEFPDFKKENLKPKIISDEEINAFRKEMEERQKEIKAKVKEFEGGEYFPDAELLNVDFDQLTKTDWYLLKLRKKGKLT